MGYNSTATTLTLTAKLTPLGRQLMVQSNGNLIANFSLGDSDANYNAVNELTTGQVPTEAGTIGPNSSVSNSTTQNTSIRSFLILNAENNSIKKSVELQSSMISSDVLSNGQTTISGANITQNLVNRSNFATDSLVNLYQSFGLSVDSSSDSNYTGVTYANGGYSDTALSGLAQTNILVLGVNNSTYGECLDGKQVKLILPTSAGTYTIYATFQNIGESLNFEDTLIGDIGEGSKFDNNVAFLFSDTIMKPNGGYSTLSWATGFGLAKPFSKNQKRLFNLQTNSNMAQSADTIVGVAYLDSGFIVITNPTIVNHYDSATASATTITFDSVSTDVYQNIICIANRGEFGTSTNPTFGETDSPRISEVGLYDINDTLIALAKLDRQTKKNINEFLTFGVKISL